MAEVSGIKLSAALTKIQTATTVEEAELQLRKNYTIPDGLVQLTRDMARQIFYHDPENVEAFLADYLEGRLEEQALADQGKYPIDASAYSNPRGEGCMNILGESMNEDGTWYNNLLAGLQNPDDRQMAALLEASRLGLNGVLDDFDGLAGYQNVDMDGEAKAKREREAEEEFEMLTGEYYTLPEGFEFLGVDLSGTSVKDIASKLNPSTGGSKAVSGTGSKVQQYSPSGRLLEENQGGADGAQYSESGRLLSGDKDGAQYSESGRLLTGDQDGAQYSESGRLLSGDKDGAGEEARYSESGRLLSGSPDGAAEGAQYTESGRLISGNQDGAQYSESGRLLSGSQDGAGADGAQYSESGRLLTGNQDGAQYSESGKLLSGSQDGAGADGAQYSESGSLLSGNQDGAGANSAQYSESGRLLSGNQDGAGASGAQYSPSGKLLTENQNGASEGAQYSESGRLLAVGAVGSGSEQGANESGLYGAGGQPGQDSSGLAGAGAGGGAGSSGGTGNEFDEFGKPISGAAAAALAAGGSSGQGQSGGGQGANGQTRGPVATGNRQNTDDNPSVLEEWPTTVQPYLSHRPNTDPVPGPQGESSNTFMVIGVTAIVVIAAGYFLARSFGYIGNSRNGEGIFGGLFRRGTSRGGGGPPVNVNVAMDVWIENQNIARALGHGLPEAQGLAKCPVPSHQLQPQPNLPPHITQIRKI